MQVIPRTKWLYVGGEHGYNLVHTLHMVDDSRDPKMPYVYTWSDPDETHEEDGGWTWGGPLNLFLKSFKPLGPAEPDGV